MRRSALSFTQCALVPFAFSFFLRQAGCLHESWGWMCVFTRHLYFMPSSLPTEYFIFFLPCSLSSCFVFLCDMLTAVGPVGICPFFFIFPPTFFLTSSHSSSLPSSSLFFASSLLLFPIRSLLPAFILHSFHTRSFPAFYTRPHSFSFSFSLSFSFSFSFSSSFSFSFSFSFLFSSSFSFSFLFSSSFSFLLS
ncbi:MAG: hypothetical protein J3R72DRAFT_235835 [Linnemannia gamsii]|nr:MAG: hypothetical protein J3R72DRAFT_235835 [Linnemannia gamsii]